MAIPIALAQIGSYRKPAVTFVTSALSGAMSAGALSITIPTHQNGDIIVLYQGGQNTTPAPVASGFTSITTTANTSGAASRSLRVSSRTGNGSSQVLSLTSNGSSSLAYAGCIILRYGSSIGSSNTFSNTTTVAVGGAATIAGTTINNPYALGAVVAMTYASGTMATVTGMTVVNSSMAYALSPAAFATRTYVAQGSIVNITATVEII